MAELTRIAPRRRAPDFAKGLRLIEVHVSCLANARDQAPQRLAFATEACGGELFTALRAVAPVDLRALAQAFDCEPDVPSIVRAAIVGVTQLMARACDAHGALLVDALETRPEELGLWIAGELAMVIGRAGRPLPAGLRAAALRSALITFGEVFGYAVPAGTAS